MTKITEVRTIPLATAGWIILAGAWYGLSATGSTVAALVALAVQILLLGFGLFQLVRLQQRVPRFRRDLVAGAVFAALLLLGQGVMVVTAISRVYMAVAAWVLLLPPLVAFLICECLFFRDLRRLAEELGVTSFVKMLGLCFPLALIQLAVMPAALAVMVVVLLLFGAGPVSAVGVALMAAVCAAIPIFHFVVALCFGIKLARGVPPPPAPSLGDCGPYPG